MGNVSSGCYVIDSEYNIINVNETARNMYPQLVIGEKCYACLMGLDRPCDMCPVANGVKGPTTYTDPIRNISEVVDAVDIEIEGCGQCHMLILSTVDSECDDVYAKALPMTAEELRSLELIKALTADYYDVFSVNINDGGMLIYRLNGKSLEHDSIYSGTISYTEGMENYIKKYVHPEDKEMMYGACTLSEIKRTLSTMESFVLHYRVILGEEIHYYYRKMVRIGDADTYDNIVIGIGCEDEIVKNRENRIALQNTLRKVELNALTGLLTKEALFIYGDKMLKTYKDSYFDFYFLKIDKLDAIRHQYGPIVRKQVIQVVAEILKDYETDTTCTTYLGEGVFTCFLESSNSEMIQGIIKQFEEQVRERCKIKNIVFKWSVYKRMNYENSTEDTYNRIVYAFNTLRGSMRNDFVELNQTLLDQIDWNLSIESNFQKALENGEFHVWFQPKYSVHSKEIIGAEALVRWIQENGAMVPPNKFIPLLEDSGLINQLDEEVFHQVCSFQKYLAEHNFPQIPISVNLSRASIFTKDIPRIYAGIAERHGISTRLIPIEITESAAVRASMIKEFADELTKYGFSIHMDDFGAGYSSLASLQMLQFECIKIDKSLVDFIGKKSGESVLKHTIAFAKEVGLHVVAEGVEKMEQYMFLKVAGCDAIQGYYFSKPVDRNTFEQMLIGAGQ